MENCLYRGKIICTFDLKDDNGFYYEDLVLDWKQAAADRMLTCSECGTHVYLAAGPIKEPYFAHYDLNDCEYDSRQESEELKKGKRLLYQLLKRSFPGADIQARFRMENGLYSTLYCILEDGRSFAVDYRLQNNSLEKFRERDNFYQANKIKPIYIMGKRQDKETKQIDWYQNLLQSSMGYLIFFDTERERLTLKRSISYRLGNIRKFAYCIKTYPIKKLTMNAEGHMNCDFCLECAKAEKKIQDEKQQYILWQDQLKKRKEEKLTKDAEDKERQEVFTRSKIQEERESKVKHNEAAGPDKAEGVGSLLSDTNKADKSGLNPELLEKCRKMIEEGNAHLVSKKYYDAIMEE